MGCYDFSLIPWAAMLFRGGLQCLAQRGGSFEDGPAVMRCRNMLQRNSLVDVGFAGPKFTWCRKENGRARLWERLDRAVASTEWMGEFPAEAV